MAQESMKEVLARRAGRPAVVAAMMLFGFTLIVVSWFGVAGEVDFLAQMPWITGGAIPGALFVGLGAMLAATRDSGRYVGRVDQVARRVTLLHDTIAAEEATTHAPPSHLVITANGVTYHRSGCRLTHGKEHRSVTRKKLPRKLRPCRLCDPDA